MVEKGIRGETDSGCRYEKANNKRMKYCDKNIEQWSLQYWDVNSLYGWECHKSFQYIILSRQKILLNIMKILQKKYNKESDEAHFF